MSKNHGPLLQAQKAVINAVVIGSSKFVDGSMTKEKAEENIVERLEEARVIYGISNCLNMMPFVIQKMMEHPRIIFHVEVAAGGQSRTVPTEGRVMWEVLQKYYDDMMGKFRSGKIEKRESLQNETPV